MAEQKSGNGQAAAGAKAAPAAKAPVGPTEVEAKLKDSDRVVKVTYDFGTNLADAVKRFGEDVVFNRYKAAAVIDLQSLMRRGIKGGKNDAEIATLAAGWKPGVKTIVAKTPVERAKAALAAMSVEEKKALLAQLQSQAGGA